MFKYIWLIPILPLAGSASIGLLGLMKLRFTGEKLSKRLVSTLALASVGLAFLLSTVIVYVDGELARAGVLAEVDQRRPGERADRIEGEIAP